MNIWTNKLPIKSHNVEGLCTPC